MCSPTKVDLVRGLGADHVVDYTVEDFADGSHRYDVILDIGGHRPLSDLRRALAPRGTLVIVGGETDGPLLGGFDRNLRAALLSPFVGQKLTMLASSENAEDSSTSSAHLDRRAERSIRRSTAPTRWTRPRPPSGTSSRAAPAARSW